MLARHEVLKFALNITQNAFLAAVLPRPAFCMLGVTLSLLRAWEYRKEAGDTTALNCIAFVMCLSAMKRSTSVGIVPTIITLAIAANSVDKSFWEIIKRNSPYGGIDTNEHGRQ